MKRFRHTNYENDSGFMEEAPDGDYVLVEDVDALVSELRLEIVRLKRVEAQRPEDTAVTKLLLKYRTACQNSPDGYGDTSCGLDRVLDCGAEASYAEIKKAKEVPSRCCECCKELDGLFPGETTT